MGLRSVELWGTGLTVGRCCSGVRVVSSLPWYGPGCSLGGVGCVGLGPLCCGPAWVLSGRPVDECGAGLFWAFPHKALAWVPWRVACTHLLGGVWLMRQGALPLWAALLVLSGEGGAGVDSVGCQSPSGTLVGDWPYLALWCLCSPPHTVILHYIHPERLWWAVLIILGGLQGCFIVVLPSTSSWPTDHHPILITP